MARTQKNAILKKAAILRAQKLANQRSQNNKKIASKKSLKTRASAVEEENFRCDSCPKSFTKLSNLNQHKKNKHGDGDNGIRVFLCPHCGEEQSPKFAHIRHFERKHPNESTDHVNENVRMKSDDNIVNLTDEAKTAMIVRLQRENISLKEENSDLKMHIEVLKTELAEKASSQKRKSAQSKVKVGAKNVKRVEQKSKKVAKTTRNQTMENSKQKIREVQPLPMKEAIQPKMKVEELKRIKPKQKKVVKTTGKPEKIESSLV